MARRREDQMNIETLTREAAEWKDSIGVNGLVFTKTRVWFDIEKQRGATYTCRGCGSNFDGRSAKVAEAILEHQCSARKGTN